MSIEQISFSENKKTGKLFLVPTPIGNMGDISKRAIETLSEVDLIAAEDTRHSGLLLQNLGIKNKLTALHEHNHETKVPELIEKLIEGINIAQISDAGTPSISDPGHQLVKEAIKNDIDVISIPGAMAGLTSLIASGLSIQPFIFVGFLPRKRNEQLTEFQKFQKLSGTYIFYESPFRIISTLENIKEYFGQEIKVVAARELTKKFETYIRGNVEEVLEFFKEKEPKGEFVLLMEVQTESTEKLSMDQALQMVISSVKDGQKATQIIKEISKDNDLDRNALYDLYNKSNG